MIDFVFYLFAIFVCLIIGGYFGFCLALLIVNSYEEQNDEKGGL